MKKLSGLILLMVLLMVLLFSVTTMASAADRESVNLFELQVQGTIETTICQEMGGVFNQNLIVESMAVPAEFIQTENIDLNILYALSGTIVKDYVNYQLKWFTHPAVLGIA